MNRSLNDDAGVYIFQRSSFLIFSHLFSSTFCPSFHCSNKVVEVELTTNLRPNQTCHSFFLFRFLLFSLLSSFSYSCLGVQFSSSRVQSLLLLLLFFFSSVCPHSKFFHTMRYSLSHNLIVTTEPLLSIYSNSIELAQERERERDKSREREREGREGEKKLGENVLTQCREGNKREKKRRKRREWLTKERPNRSSGLKSE